MDFKFNVVASFLLITICLFQNANGDLLCVDEQYRYGPANLKGCKDVCWSKHGTNSDGECRLSAGLAVCKCSRGRNPPAYYGPTGENVTNILLSLKEGQYLNSTMYVTRRASLEDLYNPSLPATPILSAETLAPFSELVGNGDPEINTDSPLCVNENYEFDLTKQKECNAACQDTFRYMMQSSGACYVTEAYAYCRCVGRRTIYDQNDHYEFYSPSGDDITKARDQLSRAVELSKLANGSSTLTFRILSDRVQAELQNIAAQNYNR